MKKQRGLKKYYKRLETYNDLDRILWFDLNKPNIWFENYHLHFDWKGFGNNSFKKRKPHLDKLFRHFDIFEERTKTLKQDFQLYAILLDRDSSSDALFIHTKNPNQDNFPIKYDELRVKSTLANVDLNNYIKNLNEYKVLYGYADEPYCVIYKPNIGIAME